MPGTLITAAGIEVDLEINCGESVQHTASRERV